METPDLVRPRLAADAARPRGVPCPRRPATDPCLSRPGCGRRVARPAGSLAGLVLLALLLGSPAGAAGPPDPNAALAEARELLAQAHERFRAGAPAEAEARLRGALALVEETFGDAHLAVAEPLWALAVFYHAQGEHERAEAALRRVLSLREAALGPEHADTARALQALADLLASGPRPEESEPFRRRLLAVQERTLGPDAPELVAPLLALGRLHARRHDYAPAEVLLTRALALQEAALGPVHPEVARLAVETARVLVAQGRHASAEALVRGALVVGPTAPGWADADLVASLTALGEIYVEQGRYGEAEPVLARAVREATGLFGASSPDLLPPSILLARVHIEQGLPRLAEPLLEEAVRIAEATLAPGDVRLAQSLHNLAVLRSVQGRYADAIELSLRALGLVEQATGADSFETAAVAAALGQLYTSVGQHDRAEPILRRALDNLERLLGPGHLRVAGVLNSLAAADLARGRLVPAAAHLERTVRILGTVLGPEHPDLATAMGNLAVGRQREGRWADAEPLLRGALRIQASALGPDHAGVAAMLGGLGETLRALGRPVEAEPVLRQALGIVERAAGASDFLRAGTLSTLALVVEAGGRLAEARDLHERARLAYLAATRAQQGLDDAEQRTFVRGSRPGLLAYATLLARLARDSAGPSGAGSPSLDAFVVAEQARTGAAGGALARAAARIADGVAAGGDLARAAQDLHHRREAVRRQLAQAYGLGPGARDPGRLAVLEGGLRQLDGDLARAVGRLREAFPAYADVAAPEPAPPGALQGVLRAGEALLSYYALPDRVLVWLLRADAPPVYREIGLTRDVLVARVTRVHRSLAQEAYVHGGAVTAADVEGAHALYVALIGPLESHLRGVNSLIIVPDEAMAALPFGALVTRADSPAFRTLAARYDDQGPLEPAELLAHADVPWLATVYTVSVLPAATSLPALRRSAGRRPAAAEPFLGFGDPVLRGHGRGRGGAMLPGPPGAADPEALRRLRALPGTREELRTLAVALGADVAGSVYVGPRATEAAVRQLDAEGRLGGARVLAFATHGLLAGELDGFAQPGLVLTPPDRPSAADDGVLSLEEILSLRLGGTEWVVLSACNTAADDGSGESLAGLARAFFFAGARTLLVSHWAVEDRATQMLMGEIFRRAAAGAAPAEALRAGALAVMRQAQGSSAHLAHPYVWAPFSVVGEGG